MKTEHLLALARKELASANFTEDAQRGAEAYLQSYDHVEPRGLVRIPAVRRYVAMNYLLVTASPPLTPDGVLGANHAQAVLKHYSSVWD